MRIAYDFETDDMFQKSDTENYTFSETFALNTMDFHMICICSCSWQ